MKVVQKIFFITIIYVIVALVHTLLPMCLLVLMGLSKFWLIVLLIFFGGLAIGIFALLPVGIIWLLFKISPNKEFTFYSTLTISALLGILQIYVYCTNPNIMKMGFVYS